MADITVDEFRERFGEFSGVADEDVAEWIQFAYELSDVTRRATMYTAAHLIALDQSERPGGAMGRADDRGGTIVAESFGPKKLQYAQMAMTAREVFYTRTPYGRMALSLENRSPSGVIGVRIG